MPRKSPREQRPSEIVMHEFAGEQIPWDLDEHLNGCLALYDRMGNRNCPIAKSWDKNGQKIEQGQWLILGWRPVGVSNPCFRRERPASWATRRTGRPFRPKQPKL